MGLESFHFLLLFEFMSIYLSLPNSFLRKKCAKETFHDAKERRGLTSKQGLKHQARMSLIYKKN